MLNNFKPTIGESSNGRMPVFETGHVGSSPASPAKLEQQCDLG